MPESTVIVLALVAGLSFKQLGFPPLLGYLLSGFMAQSVGVEAGNLIVTVADIGVTLLLFTIGLKLNLKELAVAAVWLGSSLHMLLSVLLLAGLLKLCSYYFMTLAGLSSSAIWTIAFALSFCSTVFAIKVFDEHGEAGAQHAKIAIGILIMQDLAAVVFLGIFSGKVPYLSALGLILLIPCRPLLHRLLQLVGHGELLVLFGITVALAGAELFELVGIKGDLGALLFGVLLGGHVKTNELSKSLMSLKEVFLVGFFITIGLNGLPSTELMLLAAILGVFVVFKPLLFYGIFVLLGLRARTSLLSAFSLTNYSEFGLIIAAIAAKQHLFLDEWVSVIALALSISFFLAAPFNAHAHSIYNRFQAFFHRLERHQQYRKDKPVTLSDPNVLVLGMGRVGTGAYEYLEKQFGEHVVGVEEAEKRVKKKCELGYKVVRGDASDWDFWKGVDLNKVELILISLNLHAENVEVVRLLKALNYSGKIAVIARFPDELEELRKLDCITYNLYGEAGFAFAEHAETQLSAPT